jgi:hypothetical protein
MTNHRKSDSDRPPAPEVKTSRTEREASGVVETHVVQQRAHARVPARLEVRVSTLDAHEAFGERYFIVASAMTLDVADGGLGLISDSSLPRGRRVVVELDVHAGLTIERKGSVAWCYVDRLGQHRLGIRFEESLSGLGASVPKPD